MACYHRFITFITGFFIIFSLSLFLSLFVGACVCACVWVGRVFLQQQGLVDSVLICWGSKEEKEEKVKGEEWMRSPWMGGREREMRLCVFVTRAQRELSDRGGCARKITWFAELYLSKVSPGWLVLSFPPVFGRPLPPPCIPRRSCVLMPLRTRGGEEGKKSEEEEAEEGEVWRPGHLSSSPFGGWSSLPSWTCMDGHGESWMLLPRGWAPRLRVSGASLPATAATDHRSLLRCSHR